jgi:hypothetical protein
MEPCGTPNFTSARMEEEKLAKSLVSRLTI